MTTQQHPVTEQHQAIGHVGADLGHQMDALLEQLGKQGLRQVAFVAEQLAKHPRLRMSSDDLVHVDTQGRILEGKGELSVSWPTHLKIYQAFDHIGAVIHAHPRIATIFACQEEPTKPMPPFMDAMKKYGPIPVVPRTLKVDSPEFGQWIVDTFHEKGASFQKYGHGVLYPYHGALVAAPTLDDAYDLLERMEYNATAILGSRVMGFLA